MIFLDEMSKYVDTLDVYNSGSNVSPSCFICHVYRLYTLTNAEDLDEIMFLLNHPKSAVARCAGFLYMRFVMPPSQLWDLMEEYIFDAMEMEHSLDGNKSQKSIIGQYVEALLSKDKYFNTPLPRIPARVRQQIDRELAPLHQYRKRMEANLRAFPSRGMATFTMPVEVCIDGSWVPGVAKEFCGRAVVRRKVHVVLDDETDVMVHLGKVVLRDEVTRVDSDGSADEADGRH